MTTLRFSGKEKQNELRRQYFEDSKGRTEIEIF